ncbi:efflux RND transporter periplasmic adaptor subunit [Fodinibius saliphilus]|uniref:efflux RND transporter periplasmic adaptor subunit n=1 Tax=Fodinibius saliphilus TaxID=1920650 RepID=UPI0014874845|nr:efflux RND transporter periplasmic adaptor subunit [Fodinibius saliphilus]
MSFINSYSRMLPVLVILLMLGISCSSSEETEIDPQESVRVSVEKAKARQASNSYQYAGEVTSERTVTLSTKVMGRVSQLDVEQGDYLQKGEVLVRIKDDNLQAQKNQVEARMQEAKAGLKNTETNYNRLKALHEKESATQKELDDISTQYEMAKAKVNALEGKLNEINDMLNYTVLEAPFNGYVVDKRISEGDMAAPGQPLVSFEQEGQMEVEITVPETQISHFNRGDTVSVDIKAAGIQNLMGMVAAINPSGNRGSRQFRLKVRLPELDEEAGIKSGMFARVTRNSKGEPVVTIPQSAIVERGQLTGIYTLSSNNELVLRWIRLGDSNGQNIEVLSGLAAGEQYVSNVDGTLREGQKVSTQ